VGTTTSSYVSSRELSIEITFTDVTPLECKRFAARMSGPDLSVARVFAEHAARNSTARYFGYAMRNPAFGSVRAVSARELLTLYQALKSETGYEDT
jgi:hypothetical protein